MTTTRTTDRPPPPNPLTPGAIIGLQLWIAVHPPEKNLRLVMPDRRVKILSSTFTDPRIGQVYNAFDPSDYLFIRWAEEADTDDPNGR